MTVEEVLVFTRLAADLVKATPMDRCEDVEPNPKTGKVYVACTNNTERAAIAGKPGPDAANPRAVNKDGHVIEMTEHRNRAGATTFAWNILLLCGDPADRAAGPTSPAGTVRCRPSPAPTTSPSTPTGQPVGRDRRAAVGRSRRPTGCSRCRSRAPNAVTSAVPRRARRGRDLRSGDPRHRRLGVRRRAAPRRGGQLGRPSVATSPTTSPPVAAAARRVAGPTTKRRSGDP